MTAMKAWATRMRYKFRSIPLRAASKFAVALDINAGRGQPKHMSLQQEGMTPKSIFDQEISFEGSIPCIRWSSASGEQVPLTPPQVANWIYQALVDVTSELNKLWARQILTRMGTPRVMDKVKLCCGGDRS